jgi:fatty acid desaturase
MRGIPGFIQPYLTWVTGTPLEGGKQLISWSPERAGMLGIVQMVGGIALGAWTMHPLTGWSVPLLILATLLTTGGMRRLDVVVVHQTLHRMFATSHRTNRVVGEVITTIFWRSPYDENRREHLLHHQYPCSMKDADTRYLLSTGMRPGMSRSEYRRYVWGALFSPIHHWRVSSGRVQANFTGPMPRYRLIMSLVWLAATIAFVGLTGWWAEYLVLWILPLSVCFQGATFLYTHTEHRWWIFSNAEKLTKKERDLLTFGRMCGEPVPGPEATGFLGRTGAWTKWWFRMLVVHSSYRMFVLVGDTVQHDLHHIHPNCDWANSAYVRSEDISTGSDRYTDVWGSLVDHLHEAGMVGQSPDQASEPERVSDTR